jgi:hypothetical protein
MVMVTRVQYDANSRTFKLVDPELRTLLEGDGLFDLAIPLMIEEAELEEHVLASGKSMRGRRSQQVRQSRGSSAPLAHIVLR